MQGPAGRISRRKTLITPLLAWKYFIFAVMSASSIQALPGS